MKNLLNLFIRNSSNSTLQKKVSDEMIKGAYENRKEEIKSLGKYDRGEKEITAPKLTTLSKSI